jgi:hypothetical protein
LLMCLVQGPRCYRYGHFRLHSSKYIAAGKK